MCIENLDLALQKTTRFTKVHVCKKTKCAQNDQVDQNSTGEWIVNTSFRDNQTREDKEHEKKTFRRFT